MRFTFRALPMAEIAEFALQTLREKSPVGDPSWDPHPGLYRANHMLFINGRSVASGAEWEPGQVLHISNPVPYARVIELGGMKMRVPGTDRVYLQTQQIVEARRGNQVSCAVIYIPVRFAVAGDWSRFAKTVRGGRSIRSFNRQGEALLRQPALEIKPRE